MRQRPSPSLADRSGFALVVVVLGVLALALVAHGLLLLARYDRVVARAGVGLFQARTQARLALRHAMEMGGKWPGDATPRSSEEPAARSSSAGGYVLSRRRVGREWWVVEAEGFAPGGAPRYRLRVPGWVFQVPVRLAALGGVVVVGTSASVTGPERIEAGGLRAPLPGRTGADCARWTASLDSLGVAWLPPVKRAPVSAEAPTLGLLGPDDLLARIPGRVEGVGTPGPVRGASGCLESMPWNWGDPSPGAGTCGRFRAVRAADGDLVVEGGLGQGLLVVDGDLTFSDGADFRGLVLVGGLLRLEGGARLHGMAETTGGVVVSEGSEIVGSACWAAVALDAAREVLGAPVLGAGGQPPLYLPPT